MRSVDAVEQPAERVIRSRRTLGKRGQFSYAGGGGAGGFEIVTQGVKVRPDELPVRLRRRKQVVEVSFTGGQLGDNGLNVR